MVSLYPCKFIGSHPWNNNPVQAGSTGINYYPEIGEYGVYLIRLLRTSPFFGGVSGQAVSSKPSVLGGNPGFLARGGVVESIPKPGNPGGARGGVVGSVNKKGK